MINCLTPTKYRASILFFFIGFFLLTLAGCKKNETATTSVAVPKLSVSPPGSITINSAVITGSLSSDGNSSITGSGVCWGTTPNITADSNKVGTTISSTNTNFLVTLTGLKSGKLYYVKAFAINSAGIGYSNAISLKTAGDLPIAQTGQATIITGDSMQLSATVNANNLPTKVSFEYGLTTSYGNSIDVSQNPLSGSLSVEVSVKVGGIQRYTTYHYRVGAENELGSTIGEDRTFRISDPDGTVGSVSDIEGNTYSTISIGSQIWMSENLKVTKFNDGTAIPNITDVSAWPSLATPAYCWYGNDEATYKATSYGALYNWFAASSGNLAPAGWHVPSEAEWQTLFNYLGGVSVAGGKLKEAGSAHWLDPNTGATNSSGFTALPAGALFESGFTFLGMDAFWWATTSSSSPEYAFCHFLTRDDSAIDNYNVINYKVKGFSIRCVKD